MGEREQCCRAHQRHGKQLAHRFLAVLEALGLAQDHGYRQLPGDQPDDDADEHRDTQADVDEGREALQGQIGGKGAGHEAHQDGQPEAGGRDLVVAVQDAGLDEGEHDGGDDAAQHRGDDPAGSDAAHAGPVDGVGAGRHDAGPHHAADHGMGGGDGSADVGGQVQPERSSQQGRHHQQDEGVGVLDDFRRDDAGGDGVDHFAARQHGAGGFKDGRDEQCAAQGECVGAHRRAHVVGHVVGADVERHVGPHHSGHHHHEGAGLDAGESQRGRAHQHHEGQCDAWRHQRPGHEGGSLLQQPDALQVIVERFPAPGALGGRGRGGGCGPGRRDGHVGMGRRSDRDARFACNR